MLAIALAFLAAPAASVSAGESAPPPGNGGAGLPGTHGGAGPPGPHGTVLAIGGPATPRPIAPGFLGLSLEYFSLPYYAGTNPRGVNPVFVQLIRNLAGSSPPVLRIGGDTTDESWWPAQGLSQPAGVNYALTAGWMQVTRSLATRLGARLILGVNLEADSTTIAATEAKALLAGVGRRHVEALELGNEPELYGRFTWGPSGAPGRPRAYGFSAFQQDFSKIADALPNVPLAGPAVGAPHWFRRISAFLSAHRRVTVTTVHRYPLQLCYVRPGEPDYPTVPHLLSTWSTRTLAGSVTAAVVASHARGLPVRVDEMNTVSCGSVPDVAQSFTSAMWALDVLFRMASVGVDGVNIHTFPGATYELFTFSQVHGRWRGTVAPEYYGLEMFAQAAPAGSRLLRVSESGASRLLAWATRARDGTTRVVVMNTSSIPHRISLRAAGNKATGTLELLQSDRQGVTLAGEGFGASTATGKPSGRHRAAKVAPTNGGYSFTVPAASAAMLTIPTG
ncbi:MAG: hypothetical protein JO304_05865 [Solirubrobacterales bacterium]|nr:hypothetical protein [Solirubrobacterales bacterium]